MADEATKNLETEAKGSIDPEGHVPTPAEGSATDAPTDREGIRRGKKAKLAKKVNKAAKKVNKAAKNSKKTVKAIKKNTEMLQALLQTITGLKGAAEDVKKTLESRPAGKSLESFVVEANPVTNTKSWIANYLGDSDLGGQE